MDRIKDDGTSFLQDLSTGLRKYSASLIVKGQARKKVDSFFEEAMSAVGSLRIENEKAGMVHFLFTVIQNPESKALDADPSSLSV